MSECYSISMKVDPLVKKWLDNHFKSGRGGYWFGDSCYYGLVSSLLTQSHRVGAPSVVPGKYSMFVTVRICITEYDFYHYGWNVSVMQELRFSRLIRNLIEDELLRSVAILRARYNISISNAIDFYTMHYNLDECDVKFDTLRKKYRRNYTKVEEEYRTLDRIALDERGKRTDDKKTLRIKKSRTNPSQLKLFK